MSRSNWEAEKMWVLSALLLFPFFLARASISAFCAVACLHAIHSLRKLSCSLFHQNFHGIVHFPYPRFLISSSWGRRQWSPCSWCWEVVPFVCGFWVSSLSFRWNLSCIFWSFEPFGSSDFYLPSSGFERVIAIIVWLAWRESIISLALWKAPSKDQVLLLSFCPFSVISFSNKANWIRRTIKMLLRQSVEV